MTRDPLPTQIVNQCRWCGVHTGIPFLGRYGEEVEDQALSDHLQQFSGHEAQGHYEQTPYRKGGRVYHPVRDEPMAQTLCQTCLPRRLDAYEKRKRRMMAAMGMPPEEAEHADIRLGWPGGKIPDWTEPNPAQIWHRETQRNLEREPPPLFGGRISEPEAAPPPITRQRRAPRKRAKRKTELSEESN